MAFFTAGSMVQVVLSILVSVCALAYHAYALPYRESWLNMMQGACLFFIYLTLQAGLMVQNTLPDRITGDAILVALSVANVVLLVSPVIMGLIVALQVLPESMRHRAIAFFMGTATEKVALPEPPEPEQPGPDQHDSLPDVDGNADEWETVVPPVLSDPAATDHVDATHIELTALSADAVLSADLDAWGDNPMFGSGPAPAGSLTQPSGTELADGPATLQHLQDGMPSHSLALTSSSTVRERELLRELEALRNKNDALQRENQSLVGATTEFWAPSPLAPVAERNRTSSSSM